MKPVLVTNALSRHADGIFICDDCGSAEAMLDFMSAVNSSLDAQYDKEYALIQLIEDSTERQQAMDALNARYNSDRRAAALEYAQLMADVVMPVWQKDLLIIF